jgi:hypothetical protein
MKIKHIALSIALAMAAPAAFAVDLSAGVAASNIFYIGGASAQTPGLAKAIQKFCSGTLATYTDTQDGKQAFTWTCSSANNATSGLTGPFVVSKVDAGGSFAGVNPVTNHTTMRFPDITNATVGGTPFANGAITVGSLAGSVPWNDGVAVPANIAGVQKFPQMALSDVSVNIWRARGNSIPTTGFTVNPIFAGQGFGIIVSPSLYTALQADQGLTALTGVAAIPSISKQQYANLVSGQNGISLNLLPNSATATTLRISRRSGTSGTQAASDVYFLNNPCESGTTLGGSLVPKAAGVFTDLGGTTVTVVAESSTGNVKTNVSTAAGFALGVVSLENAESGLGGAKYVKIDGVAPTYYNGVADTTQKLAVINGQYDFAFEAVMVTNDIETPAGGTAQNLADKIVADQKDGANLTTSTGLYADPTNNTTRFNTPANTNNTSNYTRNQNECKPALYVY